MKWKKNQTLAQLNQLNQNSLVSHLKIEFIQITDEITLSALMPVDSRTKQPFGLLHGGASAVLVETLGSVAAYLMIEQNEMAVGLHVEVNHIHSVKFGSVVGMARPIHIGKSTHLWNVDIFNQNDRLVATGRLTVAILKI
jgi:1,4-dihydroxy-2-naphthoyl-CoA hydrolase